MNQNVNQTPKNFSMQISLKYPPRLADPGPPEARGQLPEGHRDQGQLQEPRPEPTSHPQNTGHSQGNSGRRRRHKGAPRGQKTVARLKDRKGIRLMQCQIFWFLYFRF